VKLKLKVRDKLKITKLLKNKLKNKNSKDYNRKNWKELMKKKELLKLKRNSTGEIEGSRRGIIEEITRTIGGVETLRGTRVRIT